MVGTPLLTLSSVYAAPQWDIKMLYDGDCPLCMREVDMLKKRDKGVNKIAFVDISSEFYTPENNGGVSYEAAMERIHALLPDGTIVKDVEVFRRLYDAVGLGWVYAVTKNRTIEALANSVYDIWAKYRLPLTGRDWEIVMAKKIACGIDSAEECKIK